MRAHTIRDRYYFMKSFCVALLTVCSLCLNITSSVAGEQANSKGSLTLACSQTQQKNHGSDITFQATTNRQKYKIGDIMTLSVTPDKDALITVIDHGSDPTHPKRNHFLFKNEPVKKDQIYVFPGPDSDSDMQVSGPAGSNTFEIITSPVALTNPDAISRNVNLVKRVKPTEPKQSSEGTSSCMLKFEITE